MEEKGQEFNELAHELFAEARCGEFEKARRKRLAREKMLAGDKKVQEMFSRQQFMEKRALEAQGAVMALKNTKPEEVVDPEIARLEA